MYQSVLGDFESAKAEQFYIETLRRLNPEQKWRIACDLWQMGVETARAYLRAQHPDWPEAQVRAEIAARILDEYGTKRLPVAGD